MINSIFVLDCIASEFRHNVRVEVLDWYGEGDGERGRRSAAAVRIEYRNISSPAARAGATMQRSEIATLLAYKLYQSYQSHVSAMNPIDEARAPCSHAHMQ